MNPLVEPQRSYTPPLGEAQLVLFQGHQEQRAQACADLLLWLTHLVYVIVRVVEPPPDSRSRRIVSVFPFTLKTSRHQFWPRL